MLDNEVNIGEVIVHGIVFDPKNEDRLRTLDLNNLLASIPRLFDLLEGATHHPAVEPLLKELSHHVLPSDVEEIKRIVGQIEQEIVESQQRFRNNEQGGRQQ